MAGRRVAEAVRVDIRRSAPRAGMLNSRGFDVMTGSSGPGDPMIEMSRIANALQSWRLPIWMSDRI